MHRARPAAGPETARSSIRQDRHPRRSDLLDLPCKSVGGTAGLVMDGGAQIDAITFDSTMDLLHAELCPVSTPDLISLLRQSQPMPSVTTDELEFDFPIATK